MIKYYNYDKQITKENCIMGRVAKDVITVEYPENLYCHIAGCEPDSTNIPNDHLGLLRNMNMAIAVFKEEHSSRSTERMLKIIEMRYRDKMSMSRIGKSMNIAGSGIKNNYIDKFIRYMRDPKYSHIIKYGELNPNNTYRRNITPEDIANSIKALGLSSRAENALLRDGIETITELCSKSELYILSIETIGPVILNEIEERLASFDLCLAQFNYDILMEDISVLGLDDDLYNKLKEDKFRTIGDLIKYKERITSSSRYYYNKYDINKALKTKELKLNIKLPSQVINRDLLHELIYKLNYKDACKLLLEVRNSIGIK